MPRLSRSLVLLAALAACSSPSPPPQGGGASGDGGRPLTGSYTYDHEVGVFDGTDFVPSPTTDRLVVVERGDSLWVAVHLVRANAHTCGWSGTMGRDATGWVSHEALDVFDVFDDDATCSLRLAVTSDTLTLRDADHQCRRAYCGARASLEGAAFARTTWSPDTSAVDDF